MSTSGFGNLAAEEQPCHRIEASRKALGACTSEHDINARVAVITELMNNNIAAMINYL